MSPEEYHAYLAEQANRSGKVKTRLVAPKLHETAISADQYRAKHVDQDEHDLQSLCVEWFELQYPSLLLYAIPNAAKRSFALARRMIKEGLKKGIPDLHLAHPCHGRPGLYIETKTTNGVLSPAQMIMIPYLRSVGYVVIIPRTFEEFTQGVTEYLNGD